MISRYEVFMLEREETRSEFMHSSYMTRDTNKNLIYCSEN